LRAQISRDVHKARRFFHHLETRTQE